MHACMFLCVCWMRWVVAWVRLGVGNLFLIFILYMCWMWWG